MKKIEHTEHKLLFTDSRELALLPSESIELVVTSPPYPMITMWDDLFGSLNQDIKKALEQPLQFPGNNLSGNGNIFALHS